MGRSLISLSRYTKDSQLCTQRVLGKAGYLQRVIDKQEPCRYCDVADKVDTLTTAYWVGGGAFWFACHKSCKVVGEKEEAYQCQLIDEDCNDCKHFVRGERISKKDCKGTCEKLNNKEVVAHVQFCSSHECFEHRKG